MLNSGKKICAWHDKKKYSHVYPMIRNQHMVHQYIKKCPLKTIEEYYRPISLTCFCCKLPENIAACCKVRVMVFNATVNNIAVILSRSV
jgi:hypothetical protein